MLNLNAFTVTAAVPPLAGSQTSLGTFPTYAEAQRVVDTLADGDFPVETTQIIGSNLRMVEQVTGRRTWPTAILAGVAQGVWFGLFIGLVLSILSSASFFGAIAWGVSWGMVFWGTFAAFDYAWARGRRDFTSLSMTLPTTFEVLVETSGAARAHDVLAATT